MKNIEESELREINGGISAMGIAGLCVLGAFIVGVINGIVHPAKCD